MRIYSTCSEAIREVERDLHEMGIRVHPETMQDKDVAGQAEFETLELQNYPFTINNTSDRDSLLFYMFPDDAKKALHWAMDEFGERLSGLQINPGAAWKIREEVWEEFLHDGRFAYTYAERFAQFNQVQTVINELRIHPNSRQCIIQVHDLPDVRFLGDGANRIPCSMHYQLMIRNGRLHLTYVMRSSDFLTHFAYDLWLAMELQQYVCSKIEVLPGPFCFFTGSLHMYKKDAKEGVF